MWYLTSPCPWTSAGTKLDSNSLNIVSRGLCMMFASTLSRPRCGMPITTCWTPSPAAGRVPRDRGVQIAGVEAVGREVQQRVVGPALLQRVDGRDEVPELPVGGHEPVDAPRLGRHPLQTLPPRTQVETREKCRPVPGDRARVAPVTGVLLLDIGRVGLLNGIQWVRHDLVWDRDMGNRCRARLSRTRPCRQRAADAYVWTH